MGQNSISNHFNSQHTNPQIAQWTQGKLVSGSTHSLTAKMNFTSQNYHRASNSQSNEHSSHHVSGLASTTKQGTVVGQAKKSQLIQPLKLVAFPKLLTEADGQTVGSPAASAISGGAQTLTNTLVGSKQKPGGAQGVMFSKSKQQ